MRNFILLLSMKKFVGWGMTLPTVNSGKIYKSKLSELWLVHNPEPLVQVYLNNQRFYLFHAISLMHFIINNLESFLNTFIYTQY